MLAAFMTARVLGHNVCFNTILSVSQIFVVVAGTECNCANSEVNLRGGDNL